MNKQFDYFIDLLTNYGSLSNDEIYDLDPSIKSDSEYILQRIKDKKSQIAENQAMPWLKKTKAKMNHIRKLKEVVLNEFDEFKNFAEDFKNGNLSSPFFTEAQKFFREKGVEPTSEEELLEIFKELKLLEEIEKLDDEEK